MSGKNRRDAGADMPAWDEGAYDVTRHPAQLARRLHQRAAQLFNAASPEASLTAPQFAILATLLQTGPASQVTLGEQVSMDPSTTSAIIRKLLQSGLITRSQSSEDRRMHVIELSGAGRSLVTAHLAISRQAGRDLLKPLSPAEQRRFMDLLDRLLNSD